MTFGHVSYECKYDVIQDGAQKRTNENLQKGTQDQKLHSPNVERKNY